MGTYVEVKEGEGKVYVNKRRVSLNLILMIVTQIVSGSFGWEKIIFAFEIGNGWEILIFFFGVSRGLYFIDGLAINRRLLPC